MSLQLVLALAAGLTATAEATTIAKMCFFTQSDCSPDAKAEHTVCRFRSEAVRTGVCRCHIRALACLLANSKHCRLPPPQINGRGNDDSQDVLLHAERLFAGRQSRAHCLPISE